MKFQNNKKYIDAQKCAGMEKRMNLDFTYQNPTTIYFGKTALDNLSGELANYGDTIMLAYGN
ncbi:hypothetical protein [Clostridium sp.]|jgi:hypothetical protein|uniref:hypothetical protein n=1 Tax=Clostridium sp. TaxID=1506 RepID=UPI0025871730|nr:hypothetical protein [Clostridium sp.]MDF2503542.1 bdhA2 [Clostridium sp.]